MQYKRLDITEGALLDPPTFEFSYQDDALHNPMINEYAICAFGWADDAAMDAMKVATFKVNQVLKAMFETAGLMLVNFKLEFGFFTSRFRQDLGNVIEAYEGIVFRLGIALD